MVFPGIDEAERRVEYLYVTREALVAAAGGARPERRGPGGEREDRCATRPQRVLAALDNDLNTSVALSVIAELAKVGNEIVMQVAASRRRTRRRRRCRRGSPPRRWRRSTRAASRWG